MKFDIGAIFGQIVGFYAKLPLAQKIALPLLIAASMGVVIFVSRWATQPQYRVLFADLDPADASGIIETLRERKVSYQIRNDGRTIDVTPPESVHELRLELAGMGLPKGGQVGYELFNEPKLGLSNFGEKINWVRSLQGELERTIMSIESIRAVRVHVTDPKRSVFAKRDTPPTASVLLKLKPGAELTKQQIKGISNLVAGSVERLTPENVSILDQNGALLNEKPDTEAMAGADLTHLEYAQKIEASYVKRIETMLTEILGQGRAVARVTAILNFNRFEKEEENFDPAGQVTRSERTVAEDLGATAEGGVPGVLSNLTNDPGLLTAPDSGKNQNRRQESVKNFEVSKAVSRTVSAPGKLERLSVAVLVDGQYVAVPDEGTNEDGTPKSKQVYKPLTVEMVRKIDNLVKQAVGYDATRGDVVSIENIRFAEADEDLAEALDAAESSAALFSWGSILVPALLVVLFFFLVVRPLVRFLVTPTEAEVDLSRLLPAGIEELEAELEAERAKLSTLPERAAPAVDIEELEGLLAENSRMVRDNPQQAALLIRYWLNEGKI